MEAKPKPDYPEFKSDVSMEKCENWLEKCSLNKMEADDDSIISESQSSILTDNSAMTSGYRFETDEILFSDKVFSDRNGSVYRNDLPVVLSVNKEKANYGHINIYKSRKVHIGDVTYINGPITIVHENVERQPITSIDSLVVPRTNWLAQPALGEKQYLKAPAKYVIIGHTATEEGFTIAENTLLVRLIQTFHIESRKWNDIAYNFLIGSDGLAYEGRGWGVVGSHARTFNDQSVGVSFVGCFLDHLPPEAALEKAKKLIRQGVRRGSIDPKYVLMGHCQCSGVESPGKRLFEEVKTWERWDGSGSKLEPKVCSGNRSGAESEAVDCVP